MPDLKYGQLFRAVFFAVFLGYIEVAFLGRFLANWIALAIGIPVFAFNGWLFYGFGRKIAIFKQVFVEKLPRSCRVAKKKLWDKNQAKISSCLGSVIILDIYWFCIRDIKSEIFLERCIISMLLMAIGLLVTFCYWVVLSQGDIKGEKITNKMLGKVIIKSPVFLLRFLLQALIQALKFVIKVFVLTVYRVHSKELVVSSIYALIGMVYVAIFPPFDLAPQMIFLMSIVGGIFAGLFGCLVHWILSTAVAQNVFVKVEAWPW